MQRILRINLQARNQALKASRRKNYEKLREDWKEYEARLIQTEKVKNAHIKAERRARREDWVMGPLAPKRDVGTKQDFYGTVSNLLYQGPVFPPNVRHGPRSNGWDPVGGEGSEEDQKEWEGFGNEGNIVEGDRVCIVKGRDGLIGQIGKVKDVSNDSKELRIEGLNMADVEIPESFGEQRDKVHYSSLELPVPIADVRLVYRLTDPATGRDRDVVVKHIRGGAPYFQREPNSPLPRHTRYIAGEDVQIPWPEVEAPTYQAFEGDTTRYDVESQTWTPTIYQPPLPSQEIFDDLTEDDKYRRDRAWHEDEYVRMKILEDARAEWFKERKIQGPLAKMAEEKLKTVAERAEAVKQAGMSEETRKVLLEEMSAARGRRRQKSAS
ncbi:uncharacterized protein PV07_03074 [Cladophialophora immunda]|uniref:KOW domain-containing protein n=1 Tax=Cladophialophora immunda TaxID=569365 RepID=A0A0D2D6V4_9EURO|nr:uncharacterized protein PV07_03074 [Cladophialophora immunda]KIW31424.1 hypothetical protein PV07_03074 [Cladophialophora immunda]OQV08861.1 hypothetical protein CLAIMM_13075 [Cladophialophora immunda]